MTAATDDQPLCAVVDCTERGRPQVCVFDGKYHGHGMTHYSDFEEIVGLRFRPVGEGWFWMCSPHQSKIDAAMASQRGSR